MDSTSHHTVSSSGPDRTAPSVVPPTFDGLLAVHLRRGDFKKACLERAKWTSLYNSWNTFPDYHDVFSAPPEDGEDVEAGNSKVEVYLRHCLPSVDQVVQRIREVRSEWEAEATTADLPARSRNLTRIYIMTNAEHSFLNAVRERLESARGSGERGWESIATSADLRIPRGAAEVAMAADMQIAEKAEVFLGNGVSGWYCSG